MASRPKVYVAGPLGFSESGRRYHESVVLPALVDAGFEPLDPWVLEAAELAVFALERGHRDRIARLPDVNRAIGARNAELIRAASCVLAILDGSDVDSGTAAEIGYAAARSRPVVGLRTDLRPGGDNEATTVNLQVEWFVESTGGTICTTLDRAIQALTRLVAAGGN
ncbi:MAG TPA: nucleoside 2-deoxyribosyltransferase [Acidimicrobiia bacterium]|jgi:nucleoside 2-deoxyribosyltransferase|nr:nucleoside 2-deoxyribosyltransferase [Acidimicrobiia bacterium]